MLKCSIACSAYASIAEQKCGNNWGSRFFFHLHWINSAISRWRSNKMRVYRASLSGIKWKRAFFLLHEMARLKTWSNASSIHFWCAQRTLWAVCQNSSVPLHPFWIAFFCVLRFTIYLDISDSESFVANQTLAGDWNGQMKKCYGSYKFYFLPFRKRTNQAQM